MLKKIIYTFFLCATYCITNFTATHSFLHKKKCHKAAPQYLDEESLIKWPKRNVFEISKDSSCQEISISPMMNPMAEDEQKTVDALKEIRGKPLATYCTFISQSDKSGKVAEEMINQFALEEIRLLRSIKCDIQQMLQHVTQYKIHNTKRKIQFLSAYRPLYPLNSLDLLAGRALSNAKAIPSIIEKVYNLKPKSVSVYFPLNLSGAYSQWPRLIVLPHDYLESPYSEIAGVIGHEANHLLFDDEAFGDYLRKHHALDYDLYNRFAEKRADIIAACAGLKIARGRVQHFLRQLFPDLKKLPTINLRSSKIKRKLQACAEAPWLDATRSDQHPFDATRILYTYGLVKKLTEAKKHRRRLPATH